MIDLVFAGAFGAVFYGGFKCGNQFKTLRELFEALINKVK
jgi:hypothetical protein